jgi:hypothetical protein
MRYLLRVRQSDTDEWSQPEEFATRKERDRSAVLARAWCGFRTHSWEERTPPVSKQGERATR